MNFTYFKFLFINTIKRKPVWITWLLFLFTCICFIIILPLAAKMNTLQVWANTTMTICQTFLGMTVALFTSILAINVFKEGNEEGTDLIIISKPISRMKIILTKFALFALFCVLVNATAVLITMFTIFLPRTEVRFYWGLVVSMLIGNAVTFGVFGSIAILMSVNFAKVGIIITNIVLSLVFLIYQALAVFVFPTPSVSLADAKVAAPSYILIDRNEDGSYKENEVVRFSVVSLDDVKKGEKIVCEATNWKEMKQFWEKDILGKNPTPAINATDLASQISLTYLSYGISDYAFRQAQRMFALSRYYNYELTSPASPEIINGTTKKEKMSWLYTGSVQLQIPLEEYGTTINLFLPSSFGFAGIKPITTTRLRGYTDKIPVGYVKSKEIASQREVYFEKEDFKKYKPMFDEMYDKVFDYTRYDDLGVTLPTDFTQLDSFFGYNNVTVKHYYDIIWNTFMGKGEELSVFYDAGTYKYDATSFNIKTADDINDRFIQFKYYCYLRALNEQQNLLNNEVSTDHADYYKDAKDELQALSNLFSLNINYDKWMSKSRPGENYYTIIEPDTQTVSYQLIETEWDYVKNDTTLTEPQLKSLAHTSAKSIMKKTATIFNVVCSTKENYLFNSTTKSSRSAKLTGETHMVEDNWIPYLASLIVPMGQNMQYFYYDVHPVVEYWNYAVLWGSISLLLFAASAIVYNKYDVK